MDVVGESSVNARPHAEGERAREYESKEACSQGRRVRVADRPVYRMSFLVRRLADGLALVSGNRAYPRKVDA